VSTLQAYPGDEVLLRDGTRALLHQACDLNEGRWYCATCQVSLLGNLLMEQHVAAEPEDGSDAHMMAWACIRHGLEVP
jgi:hypothetical protein